MNKLDIKLVDTKRMSAPDAEDWYIHINGDGYGYLCKSTNPPGYAVGLCLPVGECKVQRSSIESTKDAALQFAQEHLAEMIAEAIQKFNQASGR